METYTSPQDGTTLDTYISEIATTTNYSGAADLYVGEINSAAYKYRALLQFPGLTGGDIPPGAIIATASIFLKTHVDYSSNARTMRIFRSKRDVVMDQCTWNIWKTGSDWADVGGFGADDCEQTDIGNVAVAASGVDTWYEIPLLASAVQEIKTGMWTTPTFFAKMDTESDDMWAVYSTNYTIAANRPYIVVNYSMGGVSTPMWFM